MPTASDTYIYCDDLDNIPKLHKENYLFELELLKKHLAFNTAILQIGSADGIRIIKLLQARPDLHLTGFEIDGPLIAIAKQNLSKANIEANFIEGDITQPPPLGQYDYVMCLNNTLGYIPNELAARQQMEQYGQSVIISVYGEKFTDELAREYFKSIHLQVKNIVNNTFSLEDFTKVKRYTEQEVKSWNCAKIIIIPLGYFCILK